MKPQGIAASVLAMASVLYADPIDGIDLDSSRIVTVGDLSGNLILKNKTTANGSTVSPSTTSTTYAVLSEMTLTVSTKGNKVIVTFATSFNLQSNTSDTIATYALFKDGSQLSADYNITGGHTGASTQVAFWEAAATITYIDSPTAASHTYDIRWKMGGGGNTGTLFQLGTNRTLQVVELG